MPRATQGRVLSHISSPKGIASSWLMMKRGCTVITACDDPSIAKPLEMWDPELRTVQPEEDLFAQAIHERAAAISLDWRVADLKERQLPDDALPVFYPLIGLSDDELAALHERIARS